MLLDTLSMHRRLRNAGVPDRHAEAITMAIANIVAGEFATKADLRELRVEMLGQFAEIDGKLAVINSKLAEMESKFAGIYGKFAEVRGKIAEVKNKDANQKISIADFKTTVAKCALGIIGAILIGSAGISVTIVLSLGRMAG